MTIMNAFYRSSDGRVKTELSNDQIAAALSDKQGLVWLDYLKPTEADFNFLENVFGFHHLALEDSRKQSQRAKIEEYDNYFFMVIHAVSPRSGSSESPQLKSFDLQTVEIHLFVGPNYVVSLHQQHFEPITRLIEGGQKTESRFLKKGSDLLLYTLFDAAVDTYFPTLEEIDDQIDKLEDDILINPTQSAVNKIFQFKKDLVLLRKLTGPQREIANALISRDFLNINEETLVYFRDIYDHLVRIYEMLDSYRDLLSGALDVYLGTINNQMNKIMQRLTIFAAIFMPVTFITGIFGMNFKSMPLVAYVPLGFYLALLAMAAVAAANIWWFRRNRWL